MAHSGKFGEDELRTAFYEVAQQKRADGERRDELYVCGATCRPVSRAFS